MLMLCLSVYTKKLFHVYNLSKLGPVQVSLRVYNYTNMTIIGSCVLPHFSLTLTINIADLKGSVHLRCADTFFLCLLQDIDKLHKKLLGGDKFITSQVDR